jgi:hypothetical protein
MLPLTLPSTNFIQQASTTATMHNLVQMFLCPLFSLLYLVSSVCTWSHSRGHQELVIWSTPRLYCWWGLSCGHGPYQDQPITFFLIVFLVFWHWIVPVWIRVLCSLGLVHWKSLRRLGTRHSNYYIISSYGLFIWISYLNRYGSGHRRLNKKKVILIVYPAGSHPVTCKIILKLLIWRTIDTCQNFEFYIQFWMSPNWKTKKINLRDNKILSSAADQDFAASQICPFCSTFGDTQNWM